ncbi:MAG TPA: FAD binding domain-containing protein [Thermoanaerobaculia bacterium]|nr:FAD binding domain-containing protein [Thermoanaerobaculia bacterium]
MRDFIKLLINGREHRVGAADAFTTLSNYLRYDVGATGTKIVCEEGDCGACTVLIRRNGGEFRPINSCILALAQLDGTSVVTVEGLKVDGALSAVQEAMVQCHGAQCGYCTPGFIVAMTALFENRDRVDEPCVRDGLTGNLCRCTGYEPIIKAALAVDGALAPKVKAIYSQTIDASDAVFIGADRVRPHSGATATEIAGTQSAPVFFAPTSLDDAVRFKAENDGCTIVQGGTDVGVWVNKRAFSAPALLNLSKLAELNTIRDEDGAVSVGANVTLTDFENAIRERIPELHAILHVFGSPQIKNAGTLVGNIANGSPIGDTLPYLFVSDAWLEIAGVKGMRTVPVNRFYRGYKQFDLERGDIVTRVVVPVVRDALKLYKVSRRRDLDISAVTAAIRLQLDGRRIDSARVVYGGVGPVVLQLKRTEEMLTGKEATLALFEEAGRVASSEITPISDVRGSRDYRLLVAQNLLPKFWYDVLAEG